MNNMTPIYECGLSVRARKACHLARIITVGDLRRCDRSSLMMQYKNVGVATVKELDSFVSTVPDVPPISDIDQCIRSAAHDLLAACKEAEFLAAHGVGAVNTSKDPDCVANAKRNLDECIRIQKILRAAIAKAEGSTT